MEIETALAFTDALVFAKVGTHLSDLQQAMLRSSWSMQRQSYDQIAETYGYSASYLKHDVGPKLWRLLSDVLGEKVTKTSFRTAIERRYQQPGPALTNEVSVEASADSPPSQLRQDWGNAVDVGSFYGREPELAQLQQWIVQDRCRLIAVLGMGGIGKTSLMLKLAQELSAETVEPAFTHVIWRSLRNAPPIQALLADLLHFLSNQQETNSPETVAGQIERLLHYLRTQRCLIVLDNGETVLQTTDAKPALDDHDQGYRDLWQQVGETLHQSCLILTSREKPRAVALLEGTHSPVRTLMLQGLPTLVGQQLLQLKGEFTGSAMDWQRLIEGYSGNPLALKMIATTIQTLFDGSIADFLQQNTYVFGTIRNLLEQQIDRLSAAEKTVLLELTINREPSSFAQLRSDIFPPIEPQTLIEVLETLEQRSLLEKVGALFSLQPVVMEYLTDRLVTTITTELQTSSQATARLLRSHALLKTQAKDYVRDTQIRLILQPILSRLASEDRPIAEVLQAQITLWRGKSGPETGYAAGNVINLLLQVQPRLQDWDLSALAIEQVDFRSVCLKQVNFSHSHFSHSLFTEPLGIVFTVAFTPDGTRLITGDAEGGLRIWQMQDGQLLLNLEGHQGWVWAVAVSQNGEWLASCSSDKTIRVWQVSSGDCLHILRGHTGAIWSLAFSADGEWLASGGDESTIYIWHIKTGKLQQTLIGQGGRILSLAFSPDTEMPVLASGSSDGAVRFWQIAEATFTEFAAHTDRVWSVAFSPQGNRFASGSADGTIKLWQMQPPSEKNSMPICEQILSDHRDRVRSIAFSPNGATLVSSSDDQSLRLWQVESGECTQVLNGHLNSIFSVAFNCNSQTIASGSADQTVRFWNAQTGRCLKTLQGYTNSIFSLAYSPDGETLASGSTDQIIRLWNRERGQFQTLEGHQGWVTAVAFHPHEPRLVSASADQTVRLWSLQTGQCLQIFQGHTNWVQSVSFSPDGAQIASAGDDRLIRLWSVATGQCVRELSGHTSWIWAVRFSPDGGCIASSSDDQTIRLWSVQTGECIQILQGHTGQIQSIGFSPDGQMLVSGSADETVRLWSVQTGDGLRVLHGHENNVWAVAFSPDGQRVASGSLDQTVRIWNVEQGDCLQVLPVANQSVRSSIAFHPQAADQLATGSRDGTVQLWDVQTATCLQTLQPDRPYQGTNITGITGITPAQKASLKRLGAIEL